MFVGVSFKSNIIFQLRCGPCHAIAPVYEALAKQYTSVNFFKCDVDDAQDVAQKYAVSAMRAISIHEHYMLLISGTL